ncbi:MAG TPA: bifunctional [glutamine synthetase] adenylyltransferase/[glutamine synthetase]-adenylyl-L-tyrosine phosphorylase, partial [Nocardioides sp.]|uniref:bifunctional [glutamine synthetase] adenylyltransferase/[glutamine synthetase]-adenylyl-L-tyrosine phosphorylase n=1 Tax=Nocardioides sp. TaxID=35761 RepID=UPI002BD977EB
VAGDGDVASATRLAAAMIRVCSAAGTEEALFPVDPNLRPEGRAGPLVRTLTSHLAYYERWAKTWEFQALLKARPVAGDLALGQAYADTVGPMVWQAARRDNFVEDVQAMRRRVEQSVPARQAGRELKLGPGGLRDIEFAVQLLQLVHGRTDETLRSPATLPALAALAAGGYVGRADADELGAAYRFLRRTEHLLQLNRLSRTHSLPEDPAVLRRLGRAMRFNDGPNDDWFQPALTGIRSDPAAEFDEEWRRHARQVRRLHEKLFYRPLLDAVARLPSEAARLTPAEARARLEALGYADPAGALRHIDALTSGVSRRAAIQRTLLPVLLGWFADAAEPDAGLLAFRQVSEALGSSPWYLRLLRDETRAAERMAHVLASSRYAAGLLLRAPEAVAIFGNDAELKPRSLTGLRAEMMAAIQRYEDDAEAAVTAVRSVRRRELLRTSAADTLGGDDPGTGGRLAVTGEALTDITRASLQAALEVALRKVFAELRRPLPTRFAVIAMGRFGGHECGYGSDADVLFVHDPEPGADPQQASSYAQAVANELRRLLALPGGDPPLVVDADLRPEGKQGPLTRTLSSYAAYYAKWSKVWEAQALLRADAVVGDPDLRRRFEELIDPLRFPADGISADDAFEVRRIKARVDEERLPRGADPHMHLKLGRGGLADIEWTVQLLQMRYAGQVPGLRTPRTMPALDAARDADLIGEDDAAVLQQTWRRVSRVRNAVTLVRGKPSDQLPRDPRERAAVASILGYGPGESEAMLNDHLRHTRLARAVVERVFWED